MACARKVCHMALSHGRRGGYLICTPGHGAPKRTLATLKPASQVTSQKEKKTMRGRTKKNSYAISMFTFHHAEEKILLDKK